MSYVFNPFTSKLDRVGTTSSTPIEVPFVNVTPWVVTHNLGFRPIVQLLDVAKNVIDGEIVHTSLNQFEVRFSSPQSGSALYLGATTAITPIEVAFTSLAVWTVNHGKGYRPIVNVLDASGTNIDGLITHTSINSFEVVFNTAQSGSVLYI